MAELSEKARKLFTGPNYLFVATLNSDGSPQVTPVWTDLQDGRIRFNTAIGRVKERNLRRDPRIAMSITAHSVFEVKESTTSTTARSMMIPFDRFRPTSSTRSC